MISPNVQPDVSPQTQCDKYYSKTTSFISLYIPPFHEASSVILTFRIPHFMVPGQKCHHSLNTVIEHQYMSDSVLSTKIKDLAPQGVQSLDGENKQTNKQINEHY